MPTVAEFVPGYEAIATDGLGAPKGTPAEIVTLLNATVNAALADPKIKARLEGFGGVPNPMSPEQFKTFITAETIKWAKVLKFAGAKAK